jgi:hypothetical protein
VKNPPTVDTFVYTSLSQNANDEKKPSLVLPRKPFTTACQVKFESPLSFTVNYSAIMDRQRSVSIETEIRGEQPGLEDRCLRGTIDVEFLGNQHAISVVLLPTDSKRSDTRGIAQVSIARNSCEKDMIFLKLQKLNDCLSFIHEASRWLREYPRESCCDLNEILAPMIFDAITRLKGFANKFKQSGVSDRIMLDQIHRLLAYQPNLGYPSAQASDPIDDGTNWLLKPESKRYLCRDWEKDHKVRKGSNKTTSHKFTWTGLKCPRYFECTFIHLYRPWNREKFDELVQNLAVSPRNLSKDTNIKFRSKTVDGQKRFTAGYCITIRPSPKIKIRSPQVIFYAQFGNGVVDKNDDIWWYETKTAALEALSIVIEVGSLAQKLGKIPPSFRAGQQTDR